MKIIGKNLKRLREAKHLSVNDVKEYLSLGSVQAVYKYENGKGYPPTDAMFALMELYEADMNDIIYEQKEIPYIISCVDSQSYQLHSVQRVERFKKYVELINKKGLAC